MKYYNASVYLNSQRLVKGCVIDVNEQGTIESVEANPNYTPVEGDVDCHGYVATASFMDSAVTLPGADIFSIFGINLSTTMTLEGYLGIIAAATPDTCGIRGYGLNNDIIGDEASRIKKLLDAKCPDSPAYIYFDDFTVVLVNEYILEIAKEFMQVDQEAHVDGMLDLQEYITLQEKTDIFKFSDEELRLGLMSLQYKLYSNGVTDIRVVNVIGGENTIRILSELIENGSWKITTVLEVPIYSFYSEDNIADKYEAYARYNNEYLYTAGIVITLDGSIDSAQAALLKPYECLPEWSGDILWNVNKLRRVIDTFDEIGLNIDIIAHGDRATEEAVSLLSALHGVGKKIITRAYMMSDMAILMSKGQDIIFCVEPNSVPYEGSYYEGDKEMIGDRIYSEYPIGRLMFAGMDVISGSNLPTQSDISPISGVYKATHRTNADDVTAYRMLLSYRDNPRELFGLLSHVGDLEVGHPATFVLLDKDVVNMREDLLCNCKYMATIISGEIMYTNDILGVI